MISQIHIKNFKSIVDLTIDLGRVNLFIGENGSGKSNILEAVAFLGSINTNSVYFNNELFLKGVRVTENKLFCNAFSEIIDNIYFDLIIDGHKIDVNIEFADKCVHNDGFNQFIQRLATIKTI